MTALRSSPPAALLGHPVTEIDDAATGIHRTADGHEATLELPRGDVLIWRSGERVRVVVRPSGTEPKLKVYLQVVLPVGELGDVGAIRKTAASELSSLKHDLHAVLEPTEREPQ
jgi:phosphomannomutase